jgi:hypothetical protein
MQRVTLVRYTTKPGRADENEALARAVFDELRSTAPADTAYALFRDGDDFLHLFVNTADEDASQLVELPSFKTYVQDIAARCEAPPAPQRIHMALLDAYGLARRA